MRISDWSSDVCSSDLVAAVRGADAIGIVGSRLRIVRAGRTDRRRGADRERRIQVAETGPRPRLREGEAKLQLGRQAQARADVGQEVGIGFAARYRPQDRLTTLGHAVEPVDLGLGAHGAQTDETIYGHPPARSEE